MHFRDILLWKIFKKLENYKKISMAIAQKPTFVAGNHFATIFSQLSLNKDDT